MRNLANGVTEELLETSFSEFGKLERVKKLKDYAFIHFEERDGAVKVCVTLMVSAGLETRCRDVKSCILCPGTGGNEREGVGGRANRDSVRQAARPEKEGAQSPEASG